MSYQIWKSRREGSWETWVMSVPGYYLLTILPMLESRGFYMALGDLTNRLLPTLSFHGYALPDAAHGVESRTAA